MQRFKKQIITGFTILMLLKACVIPLIYLDFELRRDYIIANLCVNRESPIIVCGGRCYLNEKIADTQQQERQAQKDYISSLIYQVMNVHQSLDWSTNTLPVTWLPEAVYHYATLPGRPGIIGDIFHPPLAG